MSTPFVPFIISIIVSERLRRYGKAYPLKQMEKPLRYALVFNLLLFVVGGILSAESVTRWIWYAWLIAQVVFILKKSEYRSLRMFTFAFIPYVAIALAGDLTAVIAPDFFTGIQNYLETARLLSYMWIAAIWFAQTQLIQSEKMASLGALTAGIAHEIQNPLNFVNNFSELSLELVVEMKEELARGYPDQAMAIADDILGNLEKIHQHGKRADATVKGMLQHSRTGTGTKEPTAINALADEYLRLSYHGLRAKDKTFNARLVTDFDQHIGQVNVIPQDIGRVLLNIFSNAFYAVNRKRLAL